MPTARLTLIGKPGCHLCDDARTVVTEVIEAFATRSEGPDIVFDEASILDDAALHERFVEDIPVLLINGDVHNYWRIDPVRLSNALVALR